MLFLSSSEDVRPGLYICEQLVLAPLEMVPEVSFILFSCVAKVNNALRTGSPASRLGVVVDGGLVNNVIISVAACVRKSTSVIFGNGTDTGKKVTVSQSLTVFVLGK